MRSALINIEGQFLEFKKRGKIVQGLRMDEYALIAC